MSLKVLIVDDHPFTRAGIRTLLSTNKDVQIIGEAENGLEAVEQVSMLRPDIVVMDINMPELSGIDATHQILKTDPDIKIIALSINKGENYVKKMLDAGAVGYLLKDEAPEELLSAIEQVEKGNIFLSSAITRAALTKSNSNNGEFGSTVLRSKLKLPDVGFDYVVRTRLISILESGINKPLALISAGPGFGKRALISQWLGQTDFKNAWICMDDEHNDIRVFFEYVIVAVESVFPELLRKSRNLLSSPIYPASDKELVNVFLNELANIQSPFVLVLENLHVIHDIKICELLNEWLKYPPPHIQLCIITQHDPPLRINPLRIGMQINEIRMDQLAFSKVEVEEFFQQSMNIDLKNEELDLVLVKTEGWVLALRLISMIIKDSEELKNVLSRAEGSLPSVYEYLLNEVFTKQTETVKEMLLSISILNRFCNDLVLELWSKGKDEREIERAKSDIPGLTRSNLFAIPLDLEKKWYRHHNLFQSFLRYQLSVRRTSSQIKELHEIAANWFEKNSMDQDAADHLTRAGLHLKSSAIPNDSGLQQSKTTKSKAKENLLQLTKKELEVLVCIAGGLTNQEIAEKLFNSEKTIKAHIYNMFQKLNVKNRLSLVKKTKDLGLID